MIKDDDIEETWNGRDALEVFALPIKYLKSGPEISFAVPAAFSTVGSNLYRIKLAPNPLAFHTTDITSLITFLISPPPTPPFPCVSNHPRYLSPLIYHLHQRHRTSLSSSSNPAPNPPTSSPQPSPSAPLQAPTTNTQSCKVSFAPSPFPSLPIQSSPNFPTCARRICRASHDIRRLHPFHFPSGRGARPGRESSPTGFRRCGEGGRNDARAQGNLGSRDLRGANRGVVAWTSHYLRTMRVC